MSAEVIEDLVKTICSYDDRPFILSESKQYTYSNLGQEIRKLEELWKTHEISALDVVVLRGDFHFFSLAALLSLALRKAILLPQTDDSYRKITPILESLQVDALVYFRSDGSPHVEKYRRNTPSLLKTLIPATAPGLVVFTSGSTGVPKGIVHDFSAVCEKFTSRASTSSHRAIPFLLFDHFGGINTALSLLSSGGSIVQITDRTPRGICRAIENFKVTLLPTTPTFLNLLLISEEWKNHDLSSLKLVTYGTEVMSEVVLKKLNSVFPSVKFKQTYGLSETGVTASQSRSNDTTWIKLGGDGLEQKVIDNILWLKSRSRLIGTLHFDQPSPRFEEASSDWFCTQDLVEQDGEWLKFKGRNTDIINVSGLKVYPSEVESCLLECEIVGAATVGAKKHALIGQMIVAQIQLKTGMDPQQARKILEAHCRERLEKFKIPQQFIFLEQIEISDRFKKKSLKSD